MRFYRALLHLYPKSFRAEYGEEMCAVFARERTSWLSAIFEVLRNAPAAHADILRQDLRHTRRTLIRAPGFTAVAILVLALGIGANTAVFSVTDYVLIRPLPFPSADRLVKLWEKLPGYRFMELSPANYRDWKRMNTVFEDMGAVGGSPVNLIGEGNPERIDAAQVTGDFFRTLGVQPLLGRAIEPSDNRDGAPLTAVLSYSLWRTLFGGDAGILGRKVDMDGTPYVVIGIMPPGFRYPNQNVELWMPMPDGYLIFYAPRDLAIRAAGNPRSLLPAVRRIIRNADPELPISNVRTLAEIVQADTSPRTVQVRILAAFAALALLRAGIGIHGLLSFMVSTRSTELAVRIALGAQPSDVLKLVLQHSLSLAAAGVVLGGALAYAAGRALQTLLAGIPLGDLATFLIAAALCFLMTLAGSPTPSIRALRVNPITALRAE